MNNPAMLGAIAAAGRNRGEPWSDGTLWEDGTGWTDAASQNFMTHSAGHAARKKIGSSVETGRRRRARRARSTVR